MLPQLLHARADEHLVQLDEVAVLLVVDLDHAPGVRAPLDRALVTSRSDPTTANGIFAAISSFSVIVTLRRRFRIAALGRWGSGGARCRRRSAGRLVSGMWEVGRASYALLETDDLLVGQGVCLGDDGDQINLGV